MRPLTLAITGLGLLLAAQILAWTALVPARSRFTPNRDVFDALQPGEFAGTLMLGGFRGLACDLLWMRADGAKQAGRFYESVALFEAISRIQPRFEQIWEYLSWDMAYNLSHEVEDRAGKWAWFVAGLRANARGATLNPQSERILRHLAWMFNHKGDNFHEEVLAEDWSRLVDPVFAEIGSRIPGGLQPLGPGRNRSNFAIAARIYDVCVRMSEAESERRGRPVRLNPFVRRMVPLALENDGNVVRNQGDHRGALERWLASLDAWQRVRQWAESQPRADNGFSDQRRMTLESYERNEGRLRRKAGQLARALAPDEAAGAAVAEAIADRRFSAARSAIAGGGWRAVTPGARVRWLDE